MGLGQSFELSAPIFRHPYRVIYGDTDTAGMVYYGNFMRLFEIGRTEFLRGVLHISYRDLEEEGLLLPVSEAYCRYKSPARYDDELEIATSLGQLLKVSVRFHYEISRPSDRKVLARGFTVHAAVDRTGGLSPLPHELHATLGRLLSPRLDAVQERHR